MIIKNDEQIELEFGKGDIRMGSTVTLYKIGYITFEDYDIPGTVNEPLFNGDVFIKSNYPITMSFTKTESIDALIGQLQYAKENMIKLQNIEEEI